MAVDLLVMRLRRDDLLEYLLVGIGDADVVHHLGKALDAVVLVEAVDGAVIKVRAALVERGGGHAARRMKRTSSGRSSVACSIYSMPSVPMTLAISCGSVMTVRGAVRNDGVGKFLGGNERAL